MSGESHWPLELLEQIEISPYLAYHGQPVDWARDCTRTLPVFTWWDICAGSARVTTARESVIAKPGEWMLIPHGVPRHQVLEKGTVLTSLNFRALWPNGNPVLELPDPVTGLRQAKLTKFARSICRILEEAKGDHCGQFVDREISLSAWLRSRGLLLSFVNELFQCAISKGGVLSGPSSGDPRLDTILSDLRRNLRAGPLPYAVWQASLGLGRSQIDRLARQHLGRGLKVVRDSFLEAEIRHHFVLGTLSAKELAAKYHFADAAHFSRWVFRMTGSSPKVLRQNAV